MDKDFIISLMSTKDSARSLQKAVGPSEIGGCRRRVWSKLNGVPKTNTSTLSAAAFFGTAIHTGIERSLRSRDPFGERYMVEVEVEHDGIMGHVDVYDRADREVLDWKTITLKKLTNKRYPFPSNQQWIQVQVYGYLLAANDYPVEKVTIVGIPRDGNETDVALFSTPYNERVALSAVQWLREVEAATEPPEPEKSPPFCSNYCGFYDASGLVGCAGA